VGALAAVAAAPVIVERLGFTGAGIAAGSAAARMMRLYRSPVPKRSTIAASQYCSQLGLPAWGSEPLLEELPERQFMVFTGAGIAAGSTGAKTLYCSQLGLPARGSQPLLEELSERQFMVFTGAGIAAGSTGAQMMRLSGRAVAKGSAIAVLQSIGTTGMGYTATVVTATAGGIVAKAIYGAQQRG